MAIEMSELTQMAAARLNEIGNLSVLQATENSGRLSAMMGIRAAQTNPIEASAIASLKQADAGGNAASNGLAGALSAILANLAHVTPATQAAVAK